MRSQKLVYYERTFVGYLRKNYTFEQTKSFMKKLYATLLFAIVNSQCFSQVPRTCGTPQLHQQLLATDPIYAANRVLLDKEVVPNSTTQNVSSVVTIPVVFQVIYSNAAENISDNRLFDQISVLNADFSRTNSNAGNTPAVFASLGANTNIQFCLAKRDPNGNATTGIVRTSTSTAPLPNFPSSIVSPWNTSQYLNIYVGNFNGILGVAQLPGGPSNSDYVCILYSTVGGPNFPGTYTPQYHLGRTATHEIGHWLNLTHTWGDDSDVNGVCNAASECGGSDFVSDTPNQCDCHYGSPSFPQISCGNGPNGDMFMNFMDYSDDAAMNIFTIGQSSRMNNAINISRSSLVNSFGCVPVSIRNSIIPQSAFQIVPNPSASGKFFVNYNVETKSPFSFCIYDVLGKKITSSEIFTQPSGKLDYDLYLNKGVYFLELNTREGILIKKLVVQ